MYFYVGCKFKFSDKISTLDRIFVFYFVLCCNLILIILFLTTKMNREELQRKIFYSDKYYDEKYEYRHVLLPKEMVKYVPKTHLMSEDEWRTLGVQQSKGWIHYMTHSPEPHILLFKRPITESPQEN